MLQYKPADGEVYFDFSSLQKYILKKNEIIDYINDVTDIFWTKWELYHTKALRRTRPSPRQKNNVISLWQKFILFTFINLNQKTNVINC